MTTLEDVVAAYAEIAAAEDRYRQKLREALAGDVQQNDVAEALGRSREKLRQDALPDEERAALRAKELERQRARRKSAGKKLAQGATNA